MTVLWPNGSTSIPRVSSEFNSARRNPVTGVVQPHNGIDLVGWADVVSPVDGTVVFAEYNGAAGNEVRIRADGPTAFHVGDYFRLLHHAALYVKTGDRVKAGAAVGRMGTTGQSTGIHCHFETHEWRLWNPINPRDFMARANTGTAGGGSSPFNEWESFMATNQEKLDRMYAALFQPVGDGGYYKTDSIIGVLRGETNLAIAGIAAGGIAFPGAPYNAFVAIVNAVRGAAGEEELDVDEEALAAALAPALAPLLIENIGTLSSGTIDELVKRLLDEQAARLAH